MIKDRNIGYKYKQDFIPAPSFNSFAGTAASVSSTASLAEVDTDGYVGLNMNADADFARAVMPIPSSWDTDNALWFRVLYTTPGAAVTIDYTVLLEQSAFGAAIANTVATVELDTTIASDTSTGSDGIDATAWGKLEGGTILESNDILVVDVESSNGGTNSSNFVGLEVAYIPKFTDGVQTNPIEDPENA